MVRNIRSYLTLTAVLSAPASAAGISRVTVLTYNHASVPPDVVEQAETRATRIFQHCGIEIRWVNCIESPVEIPRPAGVRALAWAQVRHCTNLVRAHARTCGKTRQNSRFRIIAYRRDLRKYSQYLQSRSRTGCQGSRHTNETHSRLRYDSRTRPLILGTGEPRNCWHHAGPWDRKALENIARGYMTFTAKESERMRANIRARAKAQEAR
jgi:hypothetical protein